MKQSAIMKVKERKKTTGISMPDSLKIRLKKAAGDDGRSVSDFVCRLIDKKIA